MSMGGLAADYRVLGVVSGCGELDHGSTPFQIVLMAGKLLLSARLA